MYTAQQSLQSEKVPRGLEVEVEWWFTHLTFTLKLGFPNLPQVTQTLWIWIRGVSGFASYPQTIKDTLCVWMRCWWWDGTNERMRTRWYYRATESVCGESRAGWMGQQKTGLVSHFRTTTMFFVIETTATCQLDVLKLKPNLDSFWISTHKHNPLILLAILFIVFKTLKRNPTLQFHTFS